MKQIQILNYGRKRKLQKAKNGATGNPQTYLRLTKLQSKGLNYD